MSNQTRRRFSDEFKEEAVKLITEQGYKVSEASRNLDINASMLRRWQRELSPESDGSIDADEKAELQRLRKENKTHDYKVLHRSVESTAAFFAKESK